MSHKGGGAIVGECLARQGVQYLFTLCGGHISPLLVGAKNEGIKVIDVRDEVSAAFAADAVARMSGVPGVAAVTAGPGVTNTITAVKNAQMAQSPIVIFGGATATILKGRGSLQDIDQIALMRPVTKWAVSVKTVPALGPTVDRAFEIAKSGVPGPVFVEIPVDLLYSEETVREWYIRESGLDKATGLGAKALELYLKAHLYRQFNMPQLSIPQPKLPLVLNEDISGKISEIAGLLAKAERPVLVVGSQALVNSTPEAADELAVAISQLGIPTFLGGSARGLLGRHNDLQFRHRRSRALKVADLVIVAGFPFDFRLGYGRSIGSKATLVSANLSGRDLRKNRRPDIAIHKHSGDVIRELAAEVGENVNPREAWFQTLRENEEGREKEIAAMAEVEPSEDLVNSLEFFHCLEEKMDEDAVLVVDGGDFVATAAYILRPRGPLRWLDPGVFGTLGVGGGFALGAALCHPESEVWLIYGDGSSAYSLAEFDTCIRHGLAPIAVIGTDGSWAQIAREQVEILGDDIGTVLLRSDYHKVAEGYGATGLLLTDPAKIEETIDQAKALAKAGTPVVIYVHIAKTSFRKGSISM